jgi:TrmH family RNA methyltransferase
MTRKDAGSSETSTTLSLLLDEVQDPGNLGTIIRTADWFGVRDIFCLPGTADCFNPKVVQATMSALARVRVHYFASKDDVCTWLKAYKGPIYGTFLEGENIYATQLQTPAVLVMGNEGRGVSSEVAALVTHKLLIPHFASDGQHVESLNVSVATAICLSELRRK